MPEAQSNHDALSGHIHNFERWKVDLARSLKSFRLWLRRNNLYSEPVDKRLHDLLDVLNDDYVTIAFAGEFSRGKTELINALFFSRYGQRILPSQAGRTTMCPTELYYDKQRQQTFIKLLAIETRNDPRPLTEFRKLDDYWIEEALDTSSADSMTQALQRVTETKMVSQQEAEELGFNPDHLQQQQDLVEIPMWRHAMVSFDHPMLMKGLCILDTPGLNALGSEPELTLSLLPSAQAVIFLLAADAGVTASDMVIWDEHVSQLKNRPNLGLYAVLNKVDVLWDDLSSEQEIEANIHKVLTHTAKQLDIPSNHVIPVSAQKALLGRVKQDQVLIDKSRLAHLEEILAHSILGSKEKNLWNHVIKDARDVVEDSYNLLTNRHKQLVRQRDEMASIKEASEEQTQLLLEKAEKQQQEYEALNLNFKPSLRLMDRQAEMLKETISKPKLQEQIDQAAKQMSQSHSSIGILKGMRQFFFQIDALMIDFCHEAERCNRLAQSTYERFVDQPKDTEMIPRLLTAKRFRRELNTIFADSDQFNRHLKLAFLGKNRVMGRFFNTTIYNISQFFDDLHNRVDRWSQQVLAPLSQQLDDQKETLDKHQQDLLSLRQSGYNASGQLHGLSAEIEDLEAEIKHCKDTLELLLRFKPIEEQSNIVNFKQQKFNF